MASGECLFCRIASGEEPAHVVHADGLVVAFLDARPVFPGHTLVIPRAHVRVLGELPDDLVLPLMRVVRAVSLAMESALAAEGSFVAENNHVSQSVPHLHFHVVPRTKGDGLRGFFWPRHHYASEERAAEVAALVREGISRELAEDAAPGAAG